MPPEYFPLRWESTGDQWWFASPIDWAAANGLYDVVRELLHIDTNLLIKLTSLRRIRRLETVWDDEVAFHDVAGCRSSVARKLLLECENKRGYNSLIRAGYGGWLLYTAASAGDIEFVKDLLRRDTFLVFGEGEYGVTDIFYAAARSRNREVFWMVYDSALSPRNGLSGENGKREELGDTGSDRSGFRWEMRNRAVHTAARGGNLEVLRELTGGGCDVSAFRDGQGSTILHSASSRGQVEVVRDLVALFDLITCVDNQGNTALHVAAYRGSLNVVEVLIQASPSIVSVLNNYGDTFLHLAVAGFRTPGFHRADRQMELMRQLVSGKVVDMFDIINVRNLDGRTALHLAVSENIQTNLVELLMKVPSINLNIRDADGMTPLDLLKRWPKSASSEILIKQLISAGGISNRQNHLVRRALVSHLKVRGLSDSPGTSFGIPDSEIFLYMDIDSKRGIHCDPSPEECASCLSEQSDDDLGNFTSCKRVASVNLSAGHLKSLFHWSRRKESKVDVELKGSTYDDDSLHSVSVNLEDHLVPLRQQYTKMPSLPTNKRVVSFGSSLPSPLSRKKFTAGLMHGVLLAKPQLALTGSYPSSYSGSSVSSPTSVHKHPLANLPGVSSPGWVPKSASRQMNRKQSLNRRLMNQYFCFGAQRLAVEDPITSSNTNQGHDHALMV